MKQQTQVLPSGNGSVTGSQRRDALSVQLKAAREDWLASMKLEFHHYDYRDPAVLRGIREISVWHWPKNEAATRFDQTIIVRVFADQSWSVAIDVPGLEVSDLRNQLIAMAQAGEQQAT